MRYKYLKNCFTKDKRGAIETDVNLVEVRAGDQIDILKGSKGNTIIRLGTAPVDGYVDLEQYCYVPFPKRTGPILANPEKAIFVLGLKDSHAAATIGKGGVLEYCFPISGKYLIKYHHDPFYIDYHDAGDKISGSIEAVIMTESCVLTKV